MQKMQLWHKKKMGKWNVFHLWIQAGLFEVIKGFWTHLRMHINTSYALIISYTTTIFWHAIWTSICMLIILKEDWQSTFVKVAFIIQLKCWFLIFIPGSFCSLNTHWQNICDKYFNLGFQSTFLKSQDKPSTEGMVCESQIVSSPQTVPSLEDEEKMRLEKQKLLKIC